MVVRTVRRGGRIPAAGIAAGTQDRAAKARDSRRAAGRARSLHRLRRGGLRSRSGHRQGLRRARSHLPVARLRAPADHTEIRAGKPRVEAFKNFAARTKVDDVQSLVALLVQTDKFGTSLAQALRTHAETLEDQAAPERRRTCRQARREARVPACAVPVPSALHRHSRTRRDHIRPCIQNANHQSTRSQSNEHHHSRHARRPCVLVVFYMARRRSRLSQED